MSSDRDELLQHPPTPHELEVMSVEELLEVAQAALRNRAALHELTGRVLAQLNRAGMTYEEIEARTGITRTTANRWASPYKNPS